jgi:glutamate--cysteine ligase
MDRQPPASIELRRQVAGLFSPLPGTHVPVRVGAEVELLVLDRRSPDGRGVVAVDRLRSILATDPGLVTEARFSFEPGGQLELSPLPAATPQQLGATLRRLVDRTDALLARHGIGIDSRPVDSWRTADQLGLQTPADRYVVMQRHFDSIGPAGRQMMRRTASLQINVDWLPAGAGRRQWLLANLAGPALGMAFGRPAAEVNGETRLEIWQSVDPSRTGFDGAQVDPFDPAAAYARFALAAEAMCLAREAERNSRSTSRLPIRTRFEDWARRNAARPDALDVGHHLSTLFPPVRPRGTYFEIRFVDAQPSAWLDVPVALLAVLLSGDDAVRAGLEVVGEDPSRLSTWWAAVVAGDDENLQALAIDLFDVAAGCARTRAAGWLPPGIPDLIDAYADRYLRARPRPPAAVSTRPPRPALVPMGGRG